MDITGFSGLQAVFGGTSATWKSRLKAGLPVKLDHPARSGKARTFDSVEVYNWLLRHEPARLAGGDLDKNQEQALLFKIQAQRQALALAREKVELIPATTVENVWAGMTNAARQRLLGLPNRLAATCANCSFSLIEARSTDLIFEALEEIHAFDPADYV